MRNIFKTMLLIAISVLIMGCSGHKFHTQVVPQENKVIIEADHASSINDNWSSRVTNLKYVFAAASTEAKKRGNKYFTIVSPEGLKVAIDDYKARSLNKVIESCWYGEKGFKEGDEDVLSCNAIHTLKIGGFLNILAFRPVEISVEFHNDSSRAYSFNADEVLNSEEVKPLDKKKFVQMTVE